MRYTKWFAGLALALGMGFAGAPALSAAEPYGRDAYRDRQDVRSDYSQVARLRAEIAADRARLNEDLRHGSQWAIRRDRDELACDQRMLNSLLRDARYDRNDLRHDRDAIYGFRQR